MQKLGFVFVMLFLCTASPALAQEKDETPKGNFIDKINFDEGTFLGDANVKFMKLIDSIEKWRLETKDKIKDSLDKIETRREDEEEPKTAIKVLTVLHIAFLAISLFLFSLQFVFWTAGALLSIAIARRLVGFIGNLFRRNHIEA